MRATAKLRGRKGLKFHVTVDSHNYSFFSVFFLVNISVICSGKHKTHHNTIVAIAVKYLFNLSHINPLSHLHNKHSSLLSVGMEMVAYLT